MDWIRLQETAFTAYNSASNWLLSNPFAAGTIVGVGVLGSLSFLLNRKTRRRRHLHRLLWGARMRRSRNRLPFERSSLAMAIEDCIFDMEYRGDMTKKSADEWRHSFAVRYQMDELLPRKDKETVKRGIRNRLNKGIHRIKAIIPGPLPSVKVDETYKPTDEVPVKMRSKFAA